MFWQDGEIVEATNTGKLTAAEQGRTHWFVLADEGLRYADSMARNL
jgi:hypothetical protein